MRLAVSLALAKLVGYLSRKLLHKSGETIPGKVLLTIYPRALADLQKYCAKADEILRVQSHKPDSIDTYMRQGLPIERSRSTIISQSIHHATEHRAQISDTLKVHGIRILDLDEIDLWAFSDIAGEINSPNG